MGELSLFVNEILGQLPMPVDNTPGKITVKDEKTGELVDVVDEFDEVYFGRELQCAVEDACTKIVRPRRIAQRLLFLCGLSGVGFLGNLLIAVSPLEIRFVIVIVTLLMAVAFLLAWFVYMLEENAYDYPKITIRALCLLERMCGRGAPVSQVAAVLKEFSKKRYFPRGTDPYIENKDLFDLYELHCRVCNGKVLGVRCKKSSLDLVVGTGTGEVVKSRFYSDSKSYNGIERLTVAITNDGIEQREIYKSPSETLTQ